MRWGSLMSGIAILALGMAASQPAQAQENIKGQTTQPPASTTSPAPDKKAVLVDATRVSTAKAMEAASKKKASEESAVGPPSPSGDAAVTELRPALRGQDAPPSKSEGIAAEKKSKGGPTRDIHGTVFGSTASGSQRAGAAVGASTRSGKTSIYVEAEGAKNGNSPH